MCSGHKTLQQRQVVRCQFLSPDLAILGRHSYLGMPSSRCRHEHPPKTPCTCGGPSYVFNPMNVAQTQLAINFARDFNFRPVIKNTRHLLKGPWPALRHCRSGWTPELQQLYLLRPCSDGQS